MCKYIKHGKIRVKKDWHVNYYQNAAVTFEFTVMITWCLASLSFISATQISELLV